MSDITTHTNKPMTALEIIKQFVEKHEAGASMDELFEQAKTVISDQTDPKPIYLFLWQNPDGDCEARAKGDVLKLAELLLNPAMMDEGMARVLCTAALEWLRHKGLEDIAVAIETTVTLKHLIPSQPTTPKQPA